MSINLPVGASIPENVVEVGSEISANQLAAITASNSPSAVNPFSTASHIHTIANVSGLQTALDGKSATTHLHTGVYAPVTHTHVIADVSGLQISLDGKSDTTHLHTGVYAPVSHTHVIGDTTGLQTALDGKASLSGATFTGRIGVGVAPDSVAALKVNAGGIMFNDGTTLTTAPTGGGGGAVTSVAGRTGAVVLSNTDISGLGTMATASASDYSTKIVADGLYYPLSSNPAGYLTTAPVTSVAGRTGVITLSNTDISGLGTMATASASDYSTKTVADGLYYPLSSNPAGYLTTAPVVSVAGRTGVITLSNTDISGLGTMATASTSDYYPSSNPNGYIGSSGLANYALLSGASFTGNVTASASNISARRIIGQPNAGVAGVNIGIGGTDASSTTAGDMWISTGGVSLNYRDATGAWRQILTTNTAATISVNSLTQPALRVQQLGLGPAFVVEDNTSPDSTSFCISDLGRVGIGVNPSSFAPTYNLTVNGSSVFNGVVDLTAQTVQTHTNAFTSYSNEIKVNINGVDRWIPIR